MKSTITDVAKQAGVSMKTVSRVLNNEPNVAKKTRDRVLAVAKELRYTPNLAARGLASSKSYLLALLYDNPSPNYIANIQKGAIDACRDSGYHLVIEPLNMNAANRGDALELRLERLPVDGIILTPPLCDDVDLLDILTRLKIPYVPVAPSREPEDVTSVKMDDVQASFEMTEYMIRNGHKRLGFIKGHPEHSASTLRYLGFVKAVEAAGLEVDLDAVVDGDFSFKSGVVAAERLLSAEQRPTAIFASNDDMAAAVVSVASRLGISVPGELSVGGFDDTPLAQILYPQLTTIKQPIYEMGHMAASLLIKPPKAEERLPSYCLDHKLIIRDSTQKSE
ncbi:LacI family DNA-binding transcriptional regulator [Hellea balneolensis]|uniref:LacI family DNA-binding transcriptional regulator n=1 Tax=Hellea balneolensis TaxID=287478 RepID=UPI0003F9A4E3|nr:LacI family DNA-binding transcriptional regulator [Hellea balneolensis]